MNDAANAREALREHDYKAAAEYARKLLIENPGSYPMSYMLSKPTFARLGAALDDEQLLKLFDVHLAGSEVMAGFWEDLGTCRWVSEQLEAESPLSLKELSTRASKDERPRLKTMLSWMEKVGRLHTLSGHVFRGVVTLPEVETKKVSTIPEFKEYYSTSHDMGSDQRQFYAHFREEFFKGRAMDLEGNLSYGFVLLNEILGAATTDPETASRRLKLAMTSYPKTGLERYAKLWQADVWFVAGDFQRGYDCLVDNEVLSLDIYLTLSDSVGDSRLTLPIVKSWLRSDLGLTEFGRSKQVEIESVVLGLLESHHSALGQSTVVDLWKRFLLTSEGNFDAIDVEQEFGGLVTGDGLSNSLSIFEGQKSLGGRTADRVRVLAFRGATEAKHPEVKWPTPLVNSGGFLSLAEARLRTLFREAENLVRSRNGIASIGEGWVSEMNLLNQIRQAFPEYKILHQGRPEWLKPQSLDIYFPDAGVGVEYQGLQHSQPVERFGGARAFEHQVSRDHRKRELCRQNGCKLIEVHPGYELSAVIEEVKAALP